DRIGRGDRHAPSWPRPFGVGGDHTTILHGQRPCIYADLTPSTCCELSCRTEYTAPVPSDGDGFPGADHYPPSCARPAGGGGDLPFASEGQPPYVHSDIACAST